LRPLLPSVNQDLFLKSRNYAYKLLARRPRTVKELQDKLLAREVPPEILARVIAELKTSNYLNDEAYARSWAQNRLRSKGYGPRRVEQELFHKGIPREILERVIPEIYREVDLVELAREALRKKGKGPDRDIKARRRLSSYLWRKGFPEDVIREALELEG